MSKSPDQRDPRIDEAINRYWKRNVSIMAVLLIVWAAAGLGAGVLFADTLNAWSLGGIPLGFWFAQQGSIIVFVVLILIYAVMLNRLDRQHHEDLAAILGAKTEGQT
jgi:putative solute:sodium symporter small subunit